MQNSSTAKVLNYIYDKISNVFYNGFFDADNKPVFDKNIPGKVMLAGLNWINPPEDNLYVQIFPVHVKVQTQQKAPIISPDNKTEIYETNYEYRLNARIICPASSPTGYAVAEALGWKFNTLKAINDLGVLSFFSNSDRIFEASFSTLQQKDGIYITVANVFFTILVGIREEVARKTYKSIKLEFFQVNETL